MFSAQGATFTFAPDLGGAFQANLTRLVVDSPVAELVDMTPGGADPRQIILVPTGEWRGGSVTVDLLLSESTPALQPLVGRTGFIQFASPRLNVSRRVVLESADIEASVGDLVRGSLTFRLTDYPGT